MTDSTPTYAGVERRLQAGDQRFKKLEDRIDASDKQVKAHLSAQDEHLQQQDEKLDRLAARIAAEMAALRADTKSIQVNTQSMVDTWEGGARVVRTMCRLAEAWRFVIRHVALPAMGFGTLGLIALRYMRHEPIPDWAAAVVKVLIG